MSNEKRKTIDQALESGGLDDEKIVVGLYDTDREKRIGVYFHYRFSEKLAGALIQLALEDNAVLEGLKELRQNFDLIIAAVEGTEPVTDRPLH
jgi:hypothetical protein